MKSHPPHRHRHRIEMRAELSNSNSSGSRFGGWAVAEAGSAGSAGPWSDLTEKESNQDRRKTVPRKAPAPATQPESTCSRSGQELNSGSEVTSRFQLSPSGQNRQLWHDFIRSPRIFVVDPSLDRSSCYFYLRTPRWAKASLLPSNGETQKLLSDQSQTSRVDSR